MQALKQATQQRKELVIGMIPGDGIGRVVLPVSECMKCLCIPVYLLISLMLFPGRTKSHSGSLIHLRLYHPQDILHQPQCRIRAFPKDWSSIAR